MRKTKTKIGQKDKQGNAGTLCVHRPSQKRKKRESLAKTGMSSVTENSCKEKRTLFLKSGTTVEVLFLLRKVQPRASFGEPRSASNANKHATSHGQHQYLPSKSDHADPMLSHLKSTFTQLKKVLVLAPKRNPSFRPLSAFSDGRFHSNAFHIGPVYNVIAGSAVCRIVQFFVSHWFHIFW